ncbi:hypothetical protein [Sphingomonas mesophila]|uniref:hypothetical protein n=1 Tax=Sphingomonas mesophila TaxID=2303576 RepID=UPI000E56F540|nr:hypothetical protein [Sphingomonas mesophila]
MDIVITKGEREDRIEARRGDGSVAAFRLPHKGPVPHDVVHFFVERALGRRDGFWGMVAAGRDPAEIGDLAKAAGHASAKRARAPDADFVAIIQVERLVEAFEADLWGGGDGHDGVRSMAAAGCAQSLVAPMAIDGATIDQVRGEIADFRDRWVALLAGATVTLDWPLAA